MARQPNPAVEAAWRQRMARFTRWSGAVAGFCDEEGVSTAAFYNWRRRLKTRSAKALERQPGRRQSRLEATTSEDGRGPAFVPVAVTPDVPVLIQVGDATIRVDSSHHEALRVMVRELAAAARSGGI